jgi:hypothetical protein
MEPMIKTIQEQMIAQIKTNQEETKAHWEDMKVMMKAWL